MLLLFVFVFFIWVFFHEHARFTGQQGKGEGISLTPLYHFHPLHRHLDISRAITALSSPLHIAGSRTRKRKSLTTRLRALLLLAVNELGSFLISNPFLDDCGDLYALDTKEVANQNAVKALRQVQDIGVKQFEEYLEARLWTQVTPIADTISKINMCLHQMKSRQTTRKDEELKSAKTM